MNSDAQARPRNTLSHFFTAACWMRSDYTVRRAAVNQRFADHACWYVPPQAVNKPCDCVHALPHRTCDCIYISSGDWGVAWSNPVPQNFNVFGTFGNLLSCIITLVLGYFVCAYILCRSNLSEMAVSLYGTCSFRSTVCSQNVTLVNRRFRNLTT